MPENLKGINNNSAHLGVFTNKNGGAYCFGENTNSGGSLDADCDKEALRVINDMPKWDPVMQNGKFVAVYYNLPITFAMF